MPSTKPLPTIADFRRVASDAVLAEARDRADQRTGSARDYLFGTGAVLWSRGVQYARDVFRAIYIDTADDDDLTDRLKKLWDLDRILDSYGTGFATFKRPNASAGAETFHEGTRLRVSGSEYAVAEETTTTATATYAVVPCRATDFGPGTAVKAQVAIIDDALSDPTWQCVGLTCGDGTLFELADAFRSRGRASRLDQRVGYSKSVIDTCRAAGASYVAAFPSNYAGDSNDPGLSAIYVADANFSGTPSLVTQCILALESSRVLGAEVHVGLMQSTPLSIAGTVYLWDDPGNFDLSQLANATSNALVSLFAGSTGGFTVNVDAIAGAATGISNAIQSVALSSPSADLPIMTGAPLRFPQSLPRYRVKPQNVSLTFAGPQ